MENVLEKRNEIDRQIRELYQQRMALDQEMTGTRSGNLRQILEEAIGNTEKSFPEYATVACQGVEGAYSEAAARKLFQYPGIMFFKSFDNIFSAIENGLCEYGILPIENSTVGSVNKTYDLMCDHQFYIVRSIRLKIDHNLMVKPGKRVADSQTNDRAAICSPRCAALYELQTLEDEIQDNNHNYTRFICIAKRPAIFAGADKTSFMAILANKPGSLYGVLKKFNDIGYNLIKLESRPIPDTEFQFMFYFDFEASVYHKDFIDVMCQLEEECERMEYLGSYSEKI